MIDLLVEILVVVLILGIFFWGVSQIPLQQPARAAVNVILAIVAILVLVSFLGWGPWWHPGLLHRHPW